MNTKKNTALFIFLTVSLFVLMILGIMLGSVRLKASEVIKAIFTPKNAKSSTVYIVRNMRLPRAICATLAGALLSLSGLIFQCVFRNPMADSYVLGISSAASLSVALFSLASVSFSGVFGLPSAAFAGCLAAAVLLFATNHKNPFELLLSGIAMNFLFSATTTLLVYLKRRELESIMYWTMGSLANSTLSRCIVLAAVLITITFFLESKNQTMDLLLMDNETALSSGVKTETERLWLLFAGCIAVGSVVSYCGVIGFVGLMSPHLVRLIAGPKHKPLIFLSILSGSNILLLSDIIARTVISPTELPVGIITSILGAPLLFILLKRKKSWMK